jgi:multicomponent Na+:H+ antiporter subunit D
VTTKTALYVLIRLFLGTHVLITIGVITAVLAVWYGFQENNMRRVLAFGVINQMGFKLVGVGLGTPLALAGVLAHTVCGVIYNAILWMVAGLIIHRTSVTRLSDMPTVVIQSRGLLIAAIVGGLSIAAFPFTGGFVSKSLILLAIEKQHLFGPWILLEMASVGAIFFVTCRWLYGVFFAPRSPGASVITIPLKAHVRPYIAMGILGMLSIGLGVFPSVMYSVFPNYAVFGLYIDQTWSTIYTNLPVVMASLTKILGAVVVFIMVKPSFVPGVLLDTAWLYRRSLRVITGVFIVFLDAVYAMVNRITMAGIQGLCYIYTHSLALGMYLLSIPYLRISGVSINQRALLDRYSVIARVNGLPIIASALGVILMVVFLLVTQS